MHAGDIDVFLILPGPQQGPQVVSSVLGEQVEGGKRGDGPERRTTSAGRLVHSGTQQISRSADQPKTNCVGHREFCLYKLLMLPCSVMLRREPSASAEKPRMPCGNRRACLCSHNIWTTWAEDKQTELQPILSDA